MKTKSMLRSLLLALLAVVLALSGLALIACETEVSEGPETGEYYCDVDGRENLLKLHDGNKFDLTLKGNASSGTYKLEGEQLTLTFGEGGNATGSLANGAITLTVDGSSYRFLKKVEYTVTFEADGKTVSTAQVVNGRTAARPAENPAKSGYLFVGWYADSAFRSAYYFDVPITSDTTIYGRFVEDVTHPVEFTVSFDLAGGSGAAPEPVTTKGGKVYDLPRPERAGYTFAGWWVSHYNDGSKLTYQYAEQELFENTTFFAVWTDENSGPTVSVSETGVTWAASGVNNSYSLKITAPGGGTEEKSQSTTTYAYDFAGKEAGDYTVEVTLRGKTTTAYFRNKGLARVSVFKVEDGVLSFNEVAFAEKYLIDIVCGNPDYTHSASIDLDHNTSYDFSDCDMRKEGIVFTVKAQAQASGYIESVSEPFVFEQSLSAVQGLSVNADTELASWTAVPNATSYDVTVTVDGKEAFTGTVEETQFALKTFPAGQIAVSVTPKAHGWNSSAAAQTTYRKTRIAAPSNVHVEGSGIVWDDVPGANGYELDLGGKTVRVETNEYPLPDDGATSYRISVRALAANEAQNSLYSDVVVISSGQMNDSLAYRAGVLSWDAVFGAKKYFVRVNSGDAFEVKENSCSVTLTQKGTNTIEVCAVLDDNGSTTDWVSTQVDAYEIALNDQKTSASVTTIYRADGDPYNFPAIAREGYTLSGWYTAPGGAEGDGRRITDETFTAKTDLNLYAAWDPNKITITLVLGDYAQESEKTIEFDVYYEQAYEITPPTSNNVIKTFIGFYAEPNGQGVRYTGVDGKSLFGWNQITGRTLYAAWGDVFSFKKLNNGYSVSKGREIGYLSEVTVPEKYVDETGAEFPVTVVEDFTNCTNLTVINIPDTITTISIAASSSAFDSCGKLRLINIYEVQGNQVKRYATENGLLVRFNETTGNKEVAYVPQALTGSITIPDGVQVLSVGFFRNARNVTEVKIPASVITVEANAFKSTSSSLQRVEFLASEGEESALYLYDDAFKDCSKLTEVILPARLTGFNTAIFSGCTSLTDIEIAGEGGNFAVIDGILCQKLENGSQYEALYAPKGISGQLRFDPRITSIADNAFSGNSAITGVVISEQITNIGKAAFRSDGITSLTFEGDANSYDLTIKDSAFHGNNIQSLTLPENLVSLGKNAFGKNTHLTEVTVLSGKNRSSIDFATDAFTTEIGNDNYVTTVNLGEGVPEFDVPAVFGKKIERVVVAEGNPNYSSDENGVLYDAKMASIIYYPLMRSGDFTIPESITRIGESVFEARTLLTGVTIGGNVETIGDSAFLGCTALAYVKFTPGENDLTIGESAFSGCVGLRSVELPTRTVELGVSSFYGCTALQELDIPEGVLRIGEKAFARNTQLRRVSLPATLESIGDIDAEEFDVFDDCYALAEITVGAGSEHFEVKDDVLYGKEDGKIFELIFAPRQSDGDNGSVRVPQTSGLTVRGKAFYANINITTIHFPLILEGGTLEIEPRAFSECAGLRSVDLPNGLTAIGEEVFYNCYALERIEIPNTVSSIAINAFYRCTSLKSVNFHTGNADNPLVIEGSKKTYINDIVQEGVFYKCTALEEITFPERTQYIGPGVFSGCTALRVVNLPASLEEIGDYAFYQLNVREVNLPEVGSLTKIGTHAFYETPITSINLPEGLQVIGDYAFYSCASLKEVTLPETLTTIYRYAFRNTAIEELRIPASVTQLDGDSSDPKREDGYTFGSCTSLRRVEIADNSQLTKIGYQLFSDCTSLSEIDFGENNDKLTEIGSYAFENTGFTTFTVPASVERFGICSFSATKKLTEINFEEGSNFNYMGNYCFRGSAINVFKFPDAETSFTFGTRPFMGANNLETVYLSTSVTNIDELFTGAGSIKTVVIDPLNQNFKVQSGDNVLYNMDGTAIRFVFGTASSEVYNVKDGVETIGMGAFYSHTELVSVTIPASVTTIGDNAFKNCINLQSVTFAPGSKLQYIGEDAFINCYSLNSINFEECTQFKGFFNSEKDAWTSTNSQHGTFAYCRSLKSIDLSKTQIEELTIKIFLNCTSLKDVKLPTTLKHIRGEVFSNTAIETIDWSNLTNLTALGGSYSTKPTAVAKNTSSKIFYNCKQLTSVILPDSLERIGSDMFSGCTNLQTVKLGNGITVYGNNMFADCTSLRSVEFGATAPGNTLGDSMFQNCTSLETVNLPVAITTFGNKTFMGSGLTSIDLSALTSLGGIPSSSAALNSGGCNFQDCVNLKKVILPASCAKIGTSVFYGCTSLTDINLDHVTFLGVTAFAHCGFKSVTVPVVPNASNCGNGAFRENLNLTEINFQEGCTYIGQNMFAGCTALEQVTIPASITLFHSNSSGTSNGHCFADCTSLSRVTFAPGFSADALGVYTFANCTSLTSFEFPASVTKIGHYLFSGSGLESIEIPSTITTLENGAFQNTKLKSVTIPASITSFGTNMFDGCADLSNVIFDQGFSCTKLGNYAFRGCKSLKTIDLPTSLTDIGTYTFAESGLTRIDLSGLKLTRIGITTGNLSATSAGNNFYNCVDLTDVTLPDSLQGICTAAFRGCSSLEYIDLKNVTGVSAYAFADSGLTSVTIPATMTTIFYGAFGGLQNLDAFNVAQNNSSFVSNDGVLCGTDGTIIAYPAGKTYEGGVITIDQGSVLGEYALYGVSVSEIVVAEGVTTLAKHALANVVANSITLPNTLETIGLGAFSGTKVPSLTIPESVLYIESYAFELSEIDDFIYLAKVAPQYLLNGKVSKSMSFFDKAQSLHSVYIADGLTDLSYLTFKGMADLTEVRLPETLTSIPADAFRGTGLTEITIPASVETINNAAFAEIPTLKNVTFEKPADDHMIVLGATAGSSASIVGVFQNSGIEKISIPNYVDVGFCAFSGCTQLSDVTLEEGTRRIGERAFSGCTALTGIELPESLIRIENYAFQASGLESIVIPDAVDTSITNEYSTLAYTNFGSYLFQNCASLRSVTLSKNVLEINDYAFSNCTALTSIELNDGTTSIGGNSFAGCTALSELFIPASVYEISGSAFSGWGAEQKLLIEASESVAYGCMGGTGVTEITWLRECNAQLLFNQTRNA